MSSDRVSITLCGKVIELAVTSLVRGVSFYNASLKSGQTLRGDLNPSHITPFTLELYGPWYDDSNPTGLGNTLEEAVQDLEKSIIEMRESLNPENW